MSTVLPWDFTEAQLLRASFLSSVMELCDLDPWMSARAHRLRDTLPEAEDIPLEKWRELAVLADHAEFYATTGQQHLCQMMVVQMKEVAR